jgi:hypothetical protein
MNILFEPKNAVDTVGVPTMPVVSTGTVTVVELVRVTVSPYRVFICEIITASELVLLVLKFVK